MAGVKPVPETVQELSRAPGVDSGSLIENEAADAGTARIPTARMAAAAVSFLNIKILKLFLKKKVKPNF
jgi:hypothetical protein